MLQFGGGVLQVVLGTYLWMKAFSNYQVRWEDWRGEGGIADGLGSAVGNNGCSRCRSYAL